MPDPQSRLEPRLRLEPPVLKHLSIPLMDAGLAFGDRVYGNKAGQWRRMYLRIVARAVWHARGILLWLLQRHSLRFVPLPYTFWATVESWKEPAGTLAHLKRIPAAWVKKGTFTAVNLAEAAWLRDRLGLRLAFLEDPHLDGMLAARRS